MLILNAEEVRRALPMQDAIQGMKTAYSALSTGEAVTPLRARLPIEAHDATGIFMPSYVPDEKGSAFAVKVVTLFPGNIPAGLPLIHAAVLVMDPDTGRMLALLEGGTLTAIRTGAGAGAATDILARPDARTAAIFGAGAQARTQLEAVCAVRDIEEARIFAPTGTHVRRFIEDMQPVVKARLSAAASPRQALEGADIICAATTSTSPVFPDEAVPDGAHINGVGSYTPEMVEVPPQTLSRALIAVDSREACAAEAGELIKAVETGLVSQDIILELGEIIQGSRPGRNSKTQITYFKSVGVAVQDAVAARIALANADRLGLGQKASW